MHKNRTPLGLLKRVPKVPMHILFPWYESLIILIPVYISGRPFVLRDASEPRRPLKLSDRAENLEAIEMRLKNDILLEANK